MELERIKLFELVSANTDNEKEVCEILERCFETNPDQTKIMINTPQPRESGAETLLMWAVWNLKKDVVKKLLEYGANTKYVNETMQSVSTYWNCFPKKPDEEKASEIATLLYQYGADLMLSYSGDWSIVRKAREYGLEKLRATLESLDPAYKDFPNQQWLTSKSKKH